MAWQWMCTYLHTDFIADLCLICKNSFQDCARLVVVVHEHVKGSKFIHGEVKYKLWKFYVKVVQHKFFPKSFYGFFSQRIIRGRFLWICPSFQPLPFEKLVNQLNRNTNIFHSWKSVDFWQMHLKIILDNFWAEKIHEWMEQGF